MYKKVLKQIQKKEIKQRNNSLIKSEPLKSSVNTVKINPEHGKMVAQAYDKMEHNPDHPEVKQAYDALINETKDQFHNLMGKGLKISRIESGMENPYKNSKELHADIKNNNHLWYFPTELGYGEDSSSLNHPMLQSTGIKHGDKELLANDLFRIVHDINGHHIGGESGFGPAGEHKAYLTHKQMYSPVAAKALASETLGQNSWVNFGPHAEHNTKNPHKTIYAEQKAGLLPDEIINGDWHTEKIQKSEFNLIQKNINMDEEAHPLMNRQEDKFFLPASKLQKFITLISQELKEGDIDTSVRYNTNKTIYLDSKDLDSFRDNLEAIKPRFKVRIRQYKPNDQEWESTAYIELKIKTEEGITKKTRVRIYSFMIPEIEEGKEIKADGLEIINKDITKVELWKRLIAINTIIQKYGFKKQVIVEYNRRAFSGKDIRITIDDSLRYHDFRVIDENTKKAILKSKGWEKIETPADKIKNNDYFILEVKHPGKLPKWLKEAISETKVKPVRFSKYCSAIATYLKTDNIAAPIQRQKINFNPIPIINAISVVLKSEKLNYSKEEIKQILKKHILDQILKSLKI